MAPDESEMFELNLPPEAKQGSQVSFPLPKTPPPSLGVTPTPIKSKVPDDHADGEPLYVRYDGILYAVDVPPGYSPGQEVNLMLMVQRPGPVAEEKDGASTLTAPAVRKEMVDRGTDP